MPRRAPGAGVLVSCLAAASAPGVARPARGGAVSCSAQAARPPPHFSDLPFDRTAAGALRKDPAALAAALAHPSARAVAVTARGGEALVVVRGGRPAPALLPLASVLPACAEPPILLGVGPGGAPVFAAVLPRPFLDDASRPPGAEWQSVVSAAGPAAAGPDAAVLALAVGLAAFATANAFDGASGAPLVPAEGGHARRPADGGRGRSTRPRVDPAVLALTTGGPGGRWALLGRKPSWPDRRYSLLAGFVELGETLEQAAVREVAEEAGVAVDGASLTYAGSQPWPFPRSLMVAYCGRAVEEGEGGGGHRPPRPPRPPRPHPEDVGLPCPAAAAAAAAARAADAAQASLPPAAPVDGELADVRWFHAAAVRDAVAAAAGGGGGGPPPPAGLAVPGPHALAHAVLDEWSGRVGGRPRLPSVNSEATADDGPARRPALLVLVEDAAGEPYLAVRARGGGGVDHAGLAASAVAEAAAAGAAATPLARGWLTVRDMAGPVRRLGVGGERAGLVAAVLRVALPLHAVEEADVTE